MVLDWDQKYQYKIMIFNIYSLQTLIYIYIAVDADVYDYDVCVHRCVDTYIYFLMDQSISLCCVCAKWFQQCLTLRLYGLQPASLMCPQDSPGKNTGVGCCGLLQGIFPTQGSSLCLLRLTCIGRWVLYHQRHLGSPQLPAKRTQKQHC